MIKLGKISYQNFLNVRNQEVDYGQDGLTLVVGENGSGKSALFIEGPYYLLYGASIRYGENPGAAVVTTGESSMLVRGELSLNGETFTIVRARGSDEFPLGLSIYDSSGKDINLGTSRDTQALLTRMLSLTSTGFKAVSMFSGEFGGFARSEGPKQREIVNELLMLNLFDYGYEASKQALVTARDAMTRAQAIIVERETATRRSEIAKNLLVKELEAKFEELPVLRAANLANQETLTAELKELDTKIADCVTLEENLNRLIDETESKNLPFLRREIANTQSPLSGLRREKDRLVGEANLQMQRVSELKNMATCPTCGQEVCEEHVQAIEEQALAEVEPKIRRIEELSTEIKAITARVDKLQTSLDGVTDVLQRGRTELRTATAEHHHHVEAKQWLSDELAELKRQAAEWDAVEQHAVARADQQIAENKRLLTEAKQALPPLESTLSDETFLTQLLGPSGAPRMRLIERSIPFLNEELVRAQTTMGHDIGTQFIATKNGLSLVVTNPDGASTYRGSSRGESRIIDMAVLFALLSMARQRGNRSFGQAFFDEAFDPVDESNTDKVAALLRVLGGAFVISHKPDVMEADRTWEVKDGEITVRDD